MAQAIVIVPTVVRAGLQCRECNYNCDGSLAVVSANALAHANATGHVVSVVR